MAKKPALVVLAAGMGSRYGGLKQLDPIGPGGETVIEFSIYDALRAGFDKVVFVIRRDIEEAFREQVSSKFEHRIKVEHVFQELDDLPGSHTPPSDRTKPWGTGHAVWVARDVVDEPFAVINADDFYGHRAYESLAEFLQSPVAERVRPTYALVGYELANTLSPHGTVSRGVCEIDSHGNLLGLTERTKIELGNQGPLYYDDSNEARLLARKTPVSLNLFGFTPDFMPHLGDLFEQFLKHHSDDPKAEFYLPGAVNELISTEQAVVKVLPTSEQWFGVTYAEDKANFRANIAKQIEEGRYPPRLWESR